ncbi:alanine racemase [Flavonifractor plautii]|uniref:alanine racemase n=1 Tax=Flavonifractor plautii TaxID=292800 RepID=UPI00195E7760|nr:alanine racemase [Flavonifractor plautii]MBM6665377.1 alanine racemase [Flavonifractor plautii]
MKYEEARTARAWREVDLEAVAHNAAWLQGRMGPGCRLMAVVKADAYGHGAGPVAQSLEEQGVKAFAVACLSEGIALRRQGVEGLILILGYTPPEEAAELARWGLTQCVADEAHGRALPAAGVPLEVHLALDTGMHRLGIPAEDHGAIARTRALPNLRFTGTFSHLCVSDSASSEDQAFTQTQLDRFYEAVAWMAAAGLDPGAVHIQASYGLAFRARKDTKLAVVTIGYADGLPRMLAQAGGAVLVRGVRCPMAGRMCMDQLLVDVTGVPQAAPGDVVTLIGRDGGAEIRAEEVAARCGTITNELLSRLGNRLPIQYCL